MRKLTLVLALVISTLAGVAGAQQNAQAGVSKFFFAVDFNKWSLQSSTPNVYTFSAATSCIVNPYTAQSYTFSTNAPVYIKDFGTPANSELVTPSTVFSSQGTCGFTASPGNSHYNFQVQSGTAGLQEALNWLSKTAPYPAVLMIDQNFYSAAVSIGSTTASLIGAASGGTGIALADTTTAPWTWYSWNGSAYVASASPASNGSSWTYFQNNSLVTLATGGTTTDTSTNVLPANSIIDMVQGVVNTTITGSCTGWELGDATTAGRFAANNTGLTAGTTENGAVAITTGIASATTGIWQASAAKIRITCAGGDPSAGKIRVIVYGRTFTPPAN